MTNVFLVDVESDEVDEMEFVQDYDLDEDEDDDEFIVNLPNDASVSTDFGKREFRFAKVLAINKNGTKTFTKFRQSLKTGGSATTSATGNFNTSLDITTSASGKFDVNNTFVSRGQPQKVVASGTVVSSSSSKSNIKKRRLLQQQSTNSSITLQIPALGHIDSSVRSGSDTLKLCSKTFFTLFRAQVNTTAENLLKMKSVVAGELFSRIAFANKTVSLTKSCTKAFVKSRSVDNSTTMDDSRSDEQLSDEVAYPNLFQISLIRSKTHTWTRVVSQSKTEVVVDVISCTKTRTYGKTIKKGAFVIFTGSGQVSWEKTRNTIVAKRLHNLSPLEYGVHFIRNQLESSSLTNFVGSSFETI